MLIKTPHQVPSLKEGDPVIYDHHGAPCLGVITSFQKDKASIIGSGSKPSLVPPARLDQILYPFQQLTGLQSESEIRDRVQELTTDASKRSENLSLEELWTVTAEEPREYSSSELAALLFSDTTGFDQFVLRVALHQDQVYFKRSRLFFSPRNSSVVEELKVAAEKRANFDREFDEFLTSCGKQQVDTVRYHFFVQSLLEVAAGASHLSDQQHKEVKRMLERAERELKLSLGNSREARALRLLEHAGIAHNNLNLSFHRFSVPLTFTNKEQEEAQELLDKLILNQRAKGEVDLTTLPTFTIDDRSTLDMDDGFSVWHEGTKVLLAIHISNVADWIEIDSMLDKAARRRATSLYTPEKDLHMFPAPLSEDGFSLRPDQARHCLSAVYQVASDFEVTFERFQRSYVKSTQRYGYHEVDELLIRECADFALQTAYQVAKSREAYRLENGASQIPKRESQISLHPKDQLESAEVMLEELDERSPGRSLVSELMILMNETVANVFAEKKLPLFFRSQEASNVPSDVEDLDGPAHDYAVRTSLKRSLLSSSPGPHATLGLKAYAQLTSPIRRYMDLINQHQLLAYIDQKPTPFSAEQIEELSQQLYEPLQQARQLTRAAYRFWHLRWIEERAKTSPTLEGTVLRTDNRGYLIELEELYIPTLVRTKRQLEVGESYQFVIERVNAHADILRLSPKD